MHRDRRPTLPLGVTANAVTSLDRRADDESTRRYDGTPGDGVGLECSGCDRRATAGSSEMTPSDEAPDHNWALLRAFATVSAGGGTVDFAGIDQFWNVRLNPSGEPSGRTDTLGGCSIIQTADGLVIAQASFHHMTERKLHSSFSMSDNGDGTVVWGLYNHESGEEWSATGPGSASVRYLRFNDPERDWDFLGYDADPEELYVLIDFEGPASENFSTEKSTPSSRVLCHYLPRQ